MLHTSNPDDILDAINAGENTFITGAAGSGKTYLIKQFMANNRKAILTATTGIAALNLGGETIHRFSGLGIACRPFEAGKIIGRWNAVKNSSKKWDIDKWRVMDQVETIVIDEVSMLRRDQFELLDIILSSIKENNMPFGGVQMILVGDFLQLPPVVSVSDLNKYPDMKQPYCFQSDLWQQAGFQTFNLTTNYRQGEGAFLQALGEVRVGQVSDEAAALIDGRVGASTTANVRPIKMFSLNKDVSKENIECLKQVPGPKYCSEAEYTGKDFDVDVLKKECPAEQKLYFCEGAQVMMLTNDPKGYWVNGSMGIIEQVDPIHIRLASGKRVEVGLNTWEKIKHKAKGKEIVSEVVASMAQYPFKLAYSTSIHKSQSLTLDCVELDLSRCFAPGQAYTALSRVRDISGLVVKKWSKNSIIADKVVLDFYNL